jgi:hypothetical protein
MKKLLVAVAALGLATTANAGDYHKKETLRCSQCHTMHASRAHGLNGDAAFTGSDANSALPDPGNPHRKLLIQNGTNETCLACHDGKTNVPDVLGANSMTGMDNLRSAGALNGSVGSHTATGYAEWMGHTLGSGSPPPGFVGIYEPTPVENFNCANCHAVHGSAGYRNLGLSQYMGLEGLTGPTNPFASNGPTYNAQTSPTTRDTAFSAGRDVTIGVATRSYKTTDVTFGIGSANTSSKNGMNAYCAVCHGNFHGDANTRDQIGGVDFVRHPTSAITRDNSTGSLMNGVTGTDLVRPAWAAAPSATANFEAACLSCHKGHGNARGYGLIYPAVNGVNADKENGDAVAAADGAYPIRNLCITCHPMGRY